MLLHVAALHKCNYNACTTVSLSHSENVFFSLLFKYAAMEGIIIEHFGEGHLVPLWVMVVIVGTILVMVVRVGSIPVMVGHHNHFHMKTRKHLYVRA